MPAERRSPAGFMFSSRREEIRLDERPTTEDSGRPNGTNRRPIGGEIRSHAAAESL